MRISFLLLIVFCKSYVFAQEFTDENYYLFPINPGQQNFLAGTMGELRSSHFHAGLDIKTGGRVGLPVYAAADGYVSRIKVSTGGYGQALYLVHPNGTTTVYAHLDRYSNELSKYIIEKQYEEESYEIELFPQKDQFSFKKGEVIAYSGNTGSSSGPHLHFEIRDVKQRILDPLKFNFNEIKDNIRPIVKSIGFVTLDGQARVNKMFGRYDFDVLREDGTYTTRTPIELHGLIGIEIYAYDMMNGVYSHNGISRITMKIDGDTIFKQQKTRISFGNQRSILVHMDYPEYRSSRRKFNKLFIDNGNYNDIYDTPSRGFTFSDSTHLLQIYLEDSYGNISTFESKINNKKILNPPSPKINYFEVFRNHLHLKADYEVVPNNLVIYLGGNSNTELIPYRSDSRAAYYIWDLRWGIPDSIDFCGEIKSTNVYGEIPPNTELSFYNHEVDIFFKKNSLFDTLYLRFVKEYDSAQHLEIFDFLHSSDPFNSTVKVTLKPKSNQMMKIGQVYSYYAGNLGYVGGTWKDSTISFYTRDLGTFTISNDTIDPVIKPQIINSRELYFKIHDDLSGIKSYRATLNDEFLLMSYETKRDLIWYVPNNKNTPLRGELLLEVSDNAGNIKTYKTKL